MTKEQPPLDHIACLYGLTPAHLRPVSGGNFASVYEYTDEGRACILKVMPPGTDVDLASVRATWEWLAFLAAHEGPVPRPVRSRNGSLIETVDAGGQVFVCSAVEKAPGVLAESLPLAGWDDELLQALGRAVGHCHRVARLYVPARPELERPDWDRGVNCFNPPAEELALAGGPILEQRARALVHLQALPKGPDSYGLAHLDLHFANFYVDAPRRQVALFDFDDCARGWLVMDLAMLLFDALVLYAGADRQAFSERFLQQVLRGYRSQAPMSSFWVSQLPHFLKLLEIGVYAELAQAYEPATAGPWASVFMPGRRERIERALPYADLDFEALCRRAAASAWESGC